jgi:hypothetical protein
MILLWYIVKISSKTEKQAENFYGGYPKEFFLNFENTKNGHRTPNHPI